MAEGRGPLTGTKVVGLEHSVAGPLCTRILGDLGATVIKIERPPDGDFSRHWDRNARGDSAQFWWLNRHKRSVTLNFREATARDVLSRLLADADVFVHNLNPEAADRLGLGAPEFDEAMPHLVHCQISGYGSDGPFRSRKAYDMLVQAEAGVMSLTGTPEQPCRVGVSICDVSTGIYAALLVLAALLERRASGRGRRLDVAMFDSTVEFVAPMLLSYLNAGTVYPRLPVHHHAIAPYGLFRCADGMQLVIAIEQDAEWRRFCEAVVGDVSLSDDPRFSSNTARVAHRAEVNAIVERAIGKLAFADAASEVDRLGLAYAAMNGMDGLASHPVLEARGLITEVQSSRGEGVKTLVGMAERLFAVASGDDARPPVVGEHTAGILSSLGYEPDDVRVAAAPPEGGEREPRYTALEAPE